jgi:hypothetical protein
MAAFEAMCKGFLGIGAHWHSFHYFFRFTCLRDGSRAATIGCANLRTKKGDRGEVPDLSVSGDNFDLVGGDPHHPTTSSETRSANAIAEPTPDGYRPCWRKISLITKINSCAQSKNEQESEASNLNKTRRWSSESQMTARICACSGVAKARCKTKLKL